MIRASVPGASITTDIIAGFPGETDSDHTQTLQMMRELRFTDVHVFPYSVRPNTSASLLTDDVSPETKRSRAAELRELGAIHQREALESRIGSVESVLFETSDSGLTDTYLPLRVRQGDDLTNQIRSVRVASVEDSTLLGELLG